MKFCTEGWDIFVEANCEVEAVNCWGEVCDCRRMSPTEYKVSTSNGNEFLLFLFVPAQNARCVNCKLAIGGMFVILRIFEEQMPRLWVYEQWQKLHPMFSTFVGRKEFEAQSCIG